MQYNTVKYTTDTNVRSDYITQRREYGSGLTNSSHLTTSGLQIPLGASNNAHKVHNQNNSFSAMIISDVNNNNNHHHHYY